MLKKQLREMTKPLGSNSGDRQFGRCGWIERGRRFCFEGIDAHLSLLREMRWQLRAKSSLAGKVMRARSAVGIRVPTESADSSETSRFGRGSAGVMSPSICPPCSGKNIVRNGRIGCRVSQAAVPQYSSHLMGDGSRPGAGHWVGVRPRSQRPSQWQAGPQAGVGQDTAEQGVGHPLPTQKHRPDLVATGPEEADKPSAESTTAKPVLTRPTKNEAPKVATAPIEQHAATPPAVC